MGSLFGKSKKFSTRVTEQGKAVLQLKQQRDKLKQYQKKISLGLDKEREIARKLLKEGKKDRAKLLLKKKRFQEQILNRADGQLQSLEQMVHDLEFAQVELRVIEGLKTGNEALKKIHDVIRVEDIEKILDETQEAVEKQREIDELLSGVFTQEDEDAVLQELDEIVKESLPSVADAELILPDVPQGEIEEEKQRERPKRQKVVAT